MSGDGTAAFEVEVNAEIERRAYRFGPVRIREAWAHRQGPARIATDANGRRCVLSDDADAERAVNSIHNRNKHRIPLDGETRDVRRHMEEAFEGLARGRIDVVLRQSLDGRRNSFLIFQVDLDLLTDSLAWRRTRLDYRPYSANGTDLRRTILDQRRRLAMLGGAGADRMDALTCCPVLARRVTDPKAGRAWRVMFNMALDDLVAAEQPHFVDGGIVGDVELGDGSVWSDGRLKLGRQLPDTVVGLLKGRPLSDVATHPFLPEDVTITAASQKGRRTIISTDARARRVPLKPVMERMPGGRLGRKGPPRV